jgi:hypothetical protein
VTLGFPRAQASDAVRSAVEESPSSELEELVRRALGVLGGQPAAKR